MNTSFPIVPIALAGLALYGEDAEILRGIHRYSRLTGNWVVETASHDVRSFSFDHLHRRPVGLIGHVGTPEMAEYISASGIPLINLSGSMPTRLPFPHVGVNQEKIGQVAAEHLLDLGLRQVALMAPGGVSTFDFLNARYQGFIDRIRKEDEIGIYSLPSLENPDPPPSGLDPLGLEIRSLDSLPKPCGIFAPTDRFAIILNEACFSRGIRVPEEVSILGAGNLEILCEFAHPSLSSIAPPMEKVGFEAARLLHLILQNHPVPQSTLLPGPMRVVTRQSTSQIMVEDTLVRTALIYIRDHARKGINVSDVARHCSGTRRNLEIRFRQETGESILDRIHRVRIQHARELLSTTSETITSVAKACGYSNPEHMSRAFNRYTGTTPRNIRKQSSTDI